MSCSANGSVQHWSQKFGIRVWSETVTYFCWHFLRQIFWHPKSFESSNPKFFNKWQIPIWIFRKKLSMTLKKFKSSNLYKSLASLSFLKRKWEIWKLWHSVYLMLAYALQKEYATYMKTVWKKTFDCFVWRLWAPDPFSITYSKQFCGSQKYIKFIVKVSLGKPFYC